MSGDKIVLEVKGVGMIPSFKNRKRAILDRSTGKMRTLTEPSVKKRMMRIESAILSQLYSSSQIREGETDLECRKRLLTVLSGLSDDSLNQIPAGHFDSRMVKKGEEGAIVILEEL